MNPNPQPIPPQENTAPATIHRFPMTVFYSNILLILIFLVGFCIGAYAMSWYKSSVTPSQKIKVQGVGTAPVSATDATIDLRIPQDREKYQEQIFTLVGDLQKKGIAKNKITLRYDNGGGKNEVDKVTVKLEKDTIGRVDEILAFIYTRFPKPNANENVPYIEIEYALNPEVIDLHNYQEKARKRALKDAFKNAENIASRSGSKVGKAILIEDSTDYDEEPAPDKDGMIYPNNAEDKIIQYSARYEVTYMSQ